MAIFNKKNQQKPIMSEEDLELYTEAIKERQKAADEVYWKGVIKHELMIQERKHQLDIHEKKMDIKLLEEELKIYKQREDYINDLESLARRQMKENLVVVSSTFLKTNEIAQKLIKASEEIGGFKKVISDQKESFDASIENLNKRLSRKMEKEAVKELKRIGKGETTLMENNTSV